MGTTIASGDPAFPGFDLPRAGKGNAAARRKAIIPDPRNDENLAVAQTHLAFIRFHNRVVRHAAAVDAPAQLFTRARRKVTQALPVDDPHRLPAPDRRAGDRRRRLHERPQVFEVGASPTQMPTMPIEFSVAAYRLGHSMVRAAYNWNKNFDDGAGTLELLFHFTGTSGDLGGRTIC